MSDRTMADLDAAHREYIETKGRRDDEGDRVFARFLRARRRARFERSVEIIRDGAPLDPPAVGGCEWRADRESEFHERNEPV